MIKSISDLPNIHKINSNELITLPLHLIHLSPSNPPTIYAADYSIYSGEFYSGNHSSNLGSDTLIPLILSSQWLLSFGESFRRTTTLEPNFSNMEQLIDHGLIAEVDFKLKACGQLVKGVVYGIHILNFDQIQKRLHSSNIYRPFAERVLRSLTRGSIQKLPVYSPLPKLFGKIGLTNQIIIKPEFSEKPLNTEPLLKQRKKVKVNELMLFNPRRKEPLDTQQVLISFANSSPPSSSQEEQSLPLSEHQSITSDILDEMSQSFISESVSWKNLLSGRNPRGEFELTGYLTAYSRGAACHMIFSEQIHLSAFNDGNCIIVHQESDVDDLETKEKVTIKLKCDYLKLGAKVLERRFKIV